MLSPLPAITLVCNSNRCQVCSQKFIKILDILNKLESVGVETPCSKWKLLLSPRQVAST